MSVGQIILLILSALILFGVCQRVLDKLRLTDRQALLFSALIFAGGFLPGLRLGNFVINLGGAVVPCALGVYLFIKADTGYERVRALVASLVTAAAVIALGRFFPDEPETMPFDVNYLYGLVAGVAACLFGRSRRAAFMAGVWGVTIADLIEGAVLWIEGVSQTVRLGGAGAMDVIVISGLTAVVLSEVVGEFKERCERGAEKDKTRAFKSGEIVREKTK